MPLVPLLFPDPPPLCSISPSGGESPRTDTSSPLCEVRVDIPLSRDATPAAWERSWRKMLAKSNLAGLASGGTAAISARVRVCGMEDSSRNVLEHFLPTRLHALPGNPDVQMDTPIPEGDWRGVRIWLSFCADALPGLLRRSPKPFNPFMKGRRS